MIVAVARMAFGAFVAALDTRQFHLDSGFRNRYEILVLHSKRLRRAALHDQYSIQRKKEVGFYQAFKYMLGSAYEGRTRRGQ